MSPLVAEPEIEDLTELAPRYKVLMHDDDVTTMDFVVDVLRSVFGKPRAEAQGLMMEVHTTGCALIEVVGLDEATAHVDQAKSLARARKFPLALTIEPED